MKTSENFYKAVRSRFRLEMMEKYNEYPEIIVSNEKHLLNKYSETLSNLEKMYMELNWEALCKEESELYELENREILKKVTQEMLNSN